MSENKPKPWLSSADCAERTGLSAKALRVYERYGLITPKRAPNGWRGYDLADLERLNAISVLKAIGLTLKQIRALLLDGNPPLKQVLEIQIEACAKRKLDAERTEIVARTALRRLEERQELTIEELCSLVRGAAMNSVPSQVQRLLDKHMTADEQADWRQRSTGTSQGLDDMKAYARAQQEEIFAPLKGLIDTGVQPTSPEVEALINRNNQLMTRYAVRERLVKAYESNPGNFGNALNVGRDLMRVTKEDPTKFDDLMPNVDVVAFFFRAVALSPLERRIEALVNQLQQLNQSETVTRSDVQMIAEEFCKICKEHQLGNPLIYAKWVPTRRAGLQENANAKSADAWACLVRALEQMCLPN